MRRREFIAGLGGAAAWPLAARAQQAGRMRRIGVLMQLAADDPEGQARLAAFLQGLQEANWAVGRNVRIDYRWAASDANLFRRYAAELVALAPDVILASTNQSVKALQQETRTIPIVFEKRATPPIQPIFDGERQAQLIALACSKPPPGYARWTLRLLADTVVEREIVAAAHFNTVGRALKKTISSRI